MRREGRKILVRMLLMETGRFSELLTLFFFNTSLCDGFSVGDGPVCRLAHLFYSLALNLCCLFCFDVFYLESFRI